jgi:cell division septation protein DedD
MAIALMALAAPAAGAAPPTVKTGIEAWQKGDYAAAVAIWRQLAEAGNADAAFNLGQAYRLGRGVKINLGAAQTWLQRAASKDHLEAQSTLGLLLFDSGDMKGAMRWLKAAAERGEPRAQLVYGTALFNGDGVPRDPVLGYAFVSRSASQGLSAAKGSLQDLQSLLPAQQRAQGEALAASATRAMPTRSAAPAPAAKPAGPKATAVAAARTPAAVAASSKPAPAARASSGGWRIQLGAFSKRSSAEALFKRWSGTLSGKQPLYAAAGSVTRLQVGPYASKAEAQSACAALSKQRQACFAVPPR